MSFKVQYYPLTHPQKSIWNIEQFYPESSLGNICAILKFNECIKDNLLERAINLVIRTNEGLRLRIVQDNEKQHQYISDYVYKEIDTEYIDSMSNVEEYLKQRNKERFNLINSDLFKFSIIKDYESTVCYIKTHHLISDAWTMTLIISQIDEYYHNLKKQLEIEEKNKPSYIDYIKSQDEYLKSTRFSKSKQFWEDKFKDLPEFIYFKPYRLSVKNMQADRKTFVISKSITKKLQEYCKNNNITIFNLFMSIIYVYIYRITEKKDISIGTHILNRTNKNERNMVGMFINTLPVRINIDEQVNFKTHAKKVADEVNSMLRYSNYPYQLLLEDVKNQHKNINSLYDIIVSYQNAKFMDNEYSDGYETAWCFNGAETNSLTIHINDREDNGRLVIDVDYLKNIYSVKEIVGLYKHIVNLLIDMTKFDDKTINQLSMLTNKEKYNLMYEFNRPYKEICQKDNICKIFLQQVKKDPNKVALILDEKKLTYKELGQKSDQLAGILKAKGVTSNNVVGIMVDKSFEMIIGMLAILKAGGAYLPIDITYPKDRIEYMLENSQTNLLITQTHLISNIEFKKEIIDIDKISFKDNNVICDINNIKSTDLAYIIYTSGSTGKPKGVMVEHKNLFTYVNAFQNEFNLNSKDIIIQQASCSFDTFIEEVYPILTTGGTLVIINKDDVMDAHKLSNIICENKVTIISCSPLVVKQLNDDDIQIPDSLHTIISGGDVLKKEYISKISEKLKIYNTYGPTETTVCATYYRYNKHLKAKNIPIGKPILNYKIYIMDQSKNLLPIGVPGEICIGGDGVTKGYLNNESLTNEKFIRSPFDNTLIYKTGDLGKWLENGEIEYLGRIDNQIKIRGFRIELGEIENKLLKYPCIKEAIVIPQKDKNQNNHLCAYVINDKELNVSEIKFYLSTELPDYMIPSYFIKLKEIPLTSNGKIDKKKLPKPTKIIHKTYIAPTNEVEQILTLEYEKTLKMNKISIDDNFFDVGGDSLTIMQILTNIYKYNFGIKAQDFYKYQTIKELADMINNQSKVEYKYDIQKLEELNKQVLNITYNDHSLEKEDVGNVFLTGGTGFLGAHIISSLLDTIKGNIYCLVRSETKKSAEMKLKDNLNFYFGDKYDQFIENKIYVLNGDITEKRFGLDKEDYDILIENINTVIHLAATVKYYGEYEQHEKVNVLSTKEIVDFCIKYNKKLNYISTISVSGIYLVNQTRSNIIFNENSFYVGQDYKENVYVRSKFEAEKLILEKLNSGLNATIFRIGNLTGRYEDGHFQKNINENAFYNRLKTILNLKFIPDFMGDEYIEMTPVDYCSNAIVNLLSIKQSNKKILHVFNSNMITLKNLIKILNDMRFNIKLISSDDFEKIILEEVATTDHLQGIINDLNMYNSKENNSLKTIEICNKKTLAYLYKNNFIWPDMTKKYVEKLIDYMVNNN